MTISNGITFVRLVCVPFAVRAILGEDWVLACSLFWLAVATDLADGRIARARGESTVSGGLFDHATDALFVSSGLAALAASDRVPAALPILVAVAFLQYVLDSRSLAGQPLRASRVGRWNGICYFVPVGIVVTREALRLDQPVDLVVRGLAWILVASTLVSIGDRALALFGLGRSRGAGNRSA